MKTVVEHDPRGDSHLVELCLRGDRNAFAQIVERHQSTICAIAYSGCGDIGRSEDLAQDTFVAAWKSLGELKEPERLKAWLCGIARNLMQNAVRRQQRVPTAGAVPLIAAGSAAAALIESGVSGFVWTEVRDLLEISGRGLAEVNTPAGEARGRAARDRAEAVAPAWERGHPARPSFFCSKSFSGHPTLS